jgi:hypothetical protein
MPLYLTRCPTIVSLCQLQDDAAICEQHAHGGGEKAQQPGQPQDLNLPISQCGKVRLPRYCFPVKAHVAKVPRTGSISSFEDAQRVPTYEEALGGSSDDESGASTPGSVLEPGAVPQKSLLDAMLLALWEDCAEQGLFRYDVTACPTKVLPGIYGFVAQLNEGRATMKRPTEFRVDQVGAAARCRLLPLLLLLLLLLPGLRCCAAQAHWGSCGSRRPAHRNRSAPAPHHAPPSPRSRRDAAPLAPAQPLQVCQPFDASKFNFCKAALKEVLFTFEPCHGSSPSFLEGARCGRSPNLVSRAARLAQAACLPAWHAACCLLPAAAWARGALLCGNARLGPPRRTMRWREPCPGGAGRRHRLGRRLSPASCPPQAIINVSPIEYGHVLLVPRVMDCLPQLVDPGTVLLALRFAMEAANPYFRVGYNSLGAYATINHLHFQVRWGGARAGGNGREGGGWARPEASLGGLHGGLDLLPAAPRLGRGRNPPCSHQSIFLSTVWCPG